MSQHDYIISDAVGSVFLSDLNSNLQAIVTDNSGTTEPTVTYANMVWADTSTSPPTIKRRNALNTAWVSENDMSGNVTISTNNSSAALTITQDGAGDCLVINDASADTTPIVVTSGGLLINGHTASIPVTGAATYSNIKDQVIGTSGNTSGSSNVQFAAIPTGVQQIYAKSRGTTVGSHVAVTAGETIGQTSWSGSDGTSFVTCATIIGSADATPSNGIIPGRITFNTANASGVLTETLRLNSGSVGIGGAGTVNVGLYNRKNISGDVVSCGEYNIGTIQSDVTATAFGVRTHLSTAASTFNVSNIVNYAAGFSTLGAGSTVTTITGYAADSTLAAATAGTTYGFYGNIASATSRYNFYAAGTAPNYYAGDVRTNTTVTEATTVTNSNSSTTLTAANLLGHIVSGTPVAGISYTLPTGTDLDTAFQNLSNNQAFNWSAINLAAATHAITLLANTAHTIVGNAVVQANTSGTFRTRKTAANTFVTYRIS